MNFRKSRTMMWTGFALGVLIMTIGIGCENEKATFGFIVSGTVIFALSLLQAFIFYICPHCKCSLMNLRGGIPKYCHKCGKELKEE